MHASKVTNTSGVELILSKSWTYARIWFFGCLFMCKCCLSQNMGSDRRELASCGNMLEPILAVRELFRNFSLKINPNLMRNL